MRLLWLSFALAFLTIGDAGASSFIHVAPPSAGSASSIVTLGEPAPKSAATAELTPATWTPDAANDDLVPLAYPLPNIRSAPAARAISTSPSIVVFDIPEPPVTFETVAAIGARPQQPAPSPMVIRGGIVGDGFTWIVVPAALPQTVERTTGRKTEKAIDRRRPRATARPEQLQAPPAVAPMPTSPTSAPQ